MKNLKLVCMAFSFIFLSCTDEETETVVPTQTALMVQDVEKTAQVMNEAFIMVADLITADTIDLVLKSSASKTIFINNLMSRLDEVFEIAVDGNDGLANHAAFIKIDDVKGESRSALIRALTLEDPFGQYEAAIDVAAQKFLETHDKWIVIGSYLDPNNALKGEAEITLKYNKLQQVYEFGDIFANAVMSEEEQEDALSKLSVDAGIPPVLGALLLPAVQALTADPTNDHNMNWLNTEVTPAINGGLDRDIIRRKAYFEFLVGLNLFVNQSYDNRHQYNAALNLLNARFEAQLVFIFSEIWEE